MARAFAISDVITWFAYKEKSFMELLSEPVPRHPWKVKFWASLNEKTW
jgi:hypothetical protein